MAVVVFRGGVAHVAPDGYADTPEHRALVAALDTPSFRQAIKALEMAPLGSWLAADVLTGAGWARRYLNTLALLTDRPLVDRGTRALLRVVGGRETKRGRHRAEPLTAAEAARAAAAVAAWRAVMNGVWTTDRAALTQVLLSVAGQRGIAKAHRRALSALVRRPALRRADVVLTLASWEVGLPVRRIRSAQRVADLVYG